MVPGISEKTGSTTSFIHSDRMGSMKALSSSATVSDTADYDAFGKVISRTGSSATQKGFAGGFGYQEDGESGYKLLGHRYYDADSGRFLSRDRSQDGRNWYSYVDNNPLKAIDAEGLKKKLVILVGNVAGRGTFYLAAKFLIKTIQSQYGDDYEIEIHWNATMEDCDNALSSADAVVYIGHGSKVLWELRNNVSDPNVAYQTDDMTAALARRRKPLDFVFSYSCESMGLFETFSPYCKTFLGYEGEFYYEYLFTFGIGYEAPEIAAGSGTMRPPGVKKKKKKTTDKPSFTYRDPIIFHLM